MQNIEIKARVADLAAIEARVRPLADQGPEDLEQDDTFFVCVDGRLKLRQMGPGQAELIFYRRANVRGPKVSSYFIVPVPHPDVMRQTLTDVLGTAGRVRKRRRVYRVGQTRVHLDEVEGLGTFLELEVVLERGQAIDDGKRMADKLLRALGVADTDLIPGAYLDLLCAVDGAARH